MKKRFMFLTEKIKYLKIVAIMIFVCVVSIIISYDKFGIYNPLVSLNGVLQISIFDKEYYEIQEYPKIIIADNNLKLADYMKDSGYGPTEIIKENKSVIYEFQIYESLAYVEVIDYKSFSVWKFRE